MSIGAAASAAGSLIQGVGGLVSGIQNRKALRAAAKEELRASGAQEMQLRAEARKVIGEQLAAQWGNGMEGGSGTALSAIRESQLNAAIDARELRRQGVSRAEALRKRGSMAMTEGLFSFASGLLGAGSAVSNSQSDWAQARSGSTPRRTPKPTGTI